MGLGMKMLGFTILSRPSSSEGMTDRIFIRPFHDDRNPLWPYVDDLEFVLFFSFSLTSLLCIIRRRKKVGFSELQQDYLQASDYFLTWLSYRFAGTLRKIGDLESRILSGSIQQTKIKKPIFVAGLARAGTTIVLETLAKADQVTTHRYRDFPFVMTPFLWNGFLSLLAGKQRPVERPHQDRITITRESPDAFEEPIWQHFFPFLHDPQALHQLDTQTKHPKFENFFQEHIKKILLLRKASRYLSKGNYNISRLTYIRKLFPDAYFLVPIRHPLFHVESLMRQHDLFKSYAAQNPHVPEYLEAVGHFEFGPQRRPIRLSQDGGDRIIAAWEEGDNALGYAIQWAEIYRFVADLFVTNPDVVKRLLVFRYEDLCRHPDDQIRKILEFVDLESPAFLEDAVNTIAPPSRPLQLTDEQILTCWQEVKDVAAVFGYSIDATDLSEFSTADLSQEPCHPAFH